MQHIKVLPSQEYLHECFIYMPETGLLFWRVRPVTHFASTRSCKSWNTRWAGREAFTSIVRGYSYGTLDMVRFSAHRVIFKMLHGWDPEQIDHDDHYRQNNRPDNLIPATHSKNMKNLSLYSNNKSGVSGIYWYSKTRKWKVSLGSKHVGYFNSFDTAVKARAAAMKSANYHQNHGK